MSRLVDFMFTGAVLGMMLVLSMYIGFALTGGSHDPGWGAWAVLAYAMATLWGAAVGGIVHVFYSLGR